MEPISPRPLDSDRTGPRTRSGTPWGPSWRRRATCARCGRPGQPLKVVRVERSRLDAAGVQPANLIAVCRGVCPGACPGRPMLPFVPPLAPRPSRRRSSISASRYQRLRAEVLEAAAGRCSACGRPAVLEVHHKRPIRVAPERAYDRTNLVAVCVPCHRRLDRRLPGDTGQARLLLTAA